MKTSSGGKVTTYTDGYIGRRPRSDENNWARHLSFKKTRKTIRTTTGDKILEVTEIDWYKVMSWMIYNAVSGNYEDVHFDVCILAN